MRPALAAAGALALSFCTMLPGALQPTPAGASARDWIMSGAELKKALEGQLATEAGDANLRRMLSGNRGNAYIAGLADFTRGTRWCDSAATLPHELTDRVYAWLRAAEPQRLNGNAAPLVVEALAKSFPCP